MTFLLKIVQGPNAGAEVALVEGFCVKLGRSESCDLVLADATLPDVACEMDTSADRVMLFLPGGTQERMEPFHVRFFGATGLVVGPADAPWGDLVWPGQGGAEKRAVEAPLPVEEPVQPAVPKAQKPWGRRVALGVALVLLVGLCYLLRGWCVDKGSAAVAWVRERWTSRAGSPAEPAAVPVAAPKRTLAAVAEAYGLTIQEDARGVVLSGNLATRAERLKATAEAYEAQPGVSVALSDDASFRAAAEALLGMLAEGRVQVAAAEARRLTLCGVVESEGELQRVLEALRQDVPYLEQVTCEQVVCRNLPPAEEPAVAAPRVAKARERAELPFCGILTAPYPCLVLRDGTRVTEGAEFGGFVIDRIEADRIAIHNAEGAFDWRP